MSSLSTLSKDDEMVTIPLDTIFSRPSKHAPVLTWKDVGFSVPIRKSKEHKRIIEKCSGYAKAGQMIAIMGGSGAGKSTLLNCLSGRLGPGLLQGQVLINGGPRNPNTWKTQCAYVEQEDILYQNLTVHETLTYSALLRLPQSVSIAEKSKRVDEIIQQLGLNDCKDVPVGNSESKGISGGQRKRLTIGVELVTNPDILFLDEPTSGLDAFNAFNVIETIKKVAIEQGKIVILTIHQPRTDILQLFDKIILMSAGRTVWNGTVPDALAHFEKLGYALPPNTNPSDFFIDIVTIDQRTEELEKKSLARISVFISSWEYEFSKLDYEPKIIPAIDETDNSSSVWPTSRINEIKVLLQRNMKDVMRDKASIAATVGQAIIVMVNTIRFILDTFGNSLFPNGFISSWSPKSCRLALFYCYQSNVQQYNAYNRCVPSTARNYQT